MQRRIVEGYRLSPQQKRLWPLQHDSSTFRAQCLVEIDGPLNKVTLLECLQYVVGHHDVLRTVFHRLAGMKMPVQVVKKGTDVDWQEHDLTGAEDQPARVDELYEREARSEFNLDQGPALQASLIAISELNHLLILSLPALCSDSQSIINLVKKVARAYAQGAGARNGSRTEVQYAQYSEWQNSLAGEASHKVMSSQSLMAAASLKLPLEIKANGPAAFKPASLEIAFDANAAGILAEASRRNNGSAEEFLFACWMALIGRLSSEQEIVIGRLWNGRGHERLQDALGLFAKWLPVSCRPEKDHQLAAVLEQITKSCQETYDFQERFIWGETDQPGEAASFPSIGFECEWQAEILVAGEVAMRVARQHIFTDRFKVKLVCRLGEPISAALHFDEATVTREEAQLLASRYSAVVRMAVGTSELTIGDLDVLGDEERRQVVKEWNDTRREYPTDKGLVSLFEQQAKLHGREIAVECEGERITYEELNKRANQLARHLRTRGVRAESVIAIILERSIDLVIALLAVMKSGGAYVPLDPHLPKKRVSLMLEECGSPLIITARGSRATSENADHEIIYIDSGWQTIARESSDNLETTYSPENLAYILFTSGSTGKPKGVAVEHRQLLNYVNAITERLELPLAASYATVSTFSADLGNTVIFPSLCMGGRLHVISQERASDPAALAHYFANHSIDCLKIVPSHLMALLASSTTESPIPRKRLILGGEASHWSLIDKLESLKPDCLIFNHYGPTETTVGVATYSVSRAERPPSAATVPIGKPISNLEAYILDSDLMPVPIGVAGELYFGGEGVTRGYLNRPELTADRFLPDPLTTRAGARMYRTGDLGRYLPDGNIEFLGRVDHQVKYHGFRVELAEIVAALNRHPKIRNSVVRITRDKNGEDVLIAYYVSRKEIELGELRVFLSDTIIEETLPNVFVHLKKLPLTINGKINYDLLPTLEEARQRIRREFLAPRNQIEETLAQICADVLGLESVNLNDNFFELGGHSLLATRVISRINETWKLEIPVRRLFEARSIASLAEMIADQIGQRERGPEPAIEAIHRRTRSIDEQLAELNEISEDEARALLDV
jgi:amino acid adenylation domain-containing protein